jgi:hypothetical protein
MTPVIVNVNPGICGFECEVKAEPVGKRSVRIQISGSGCTLIETFSGQLHEITLQDLFVPLTKNQIFVAAQHARCHLACPVPAAVVKACEVALGLAVPKDAAICFSTLKSTPERP